MSRRKAKPAPRFSNPVRENRTVMVAVRITPAEAEVLDGLVARLGVDGRSGVFRAGLDALLASLPPEKG